MQLDLLPLLECPLDRRSLDLLEATIVGDKISETMNGKKIHDNVACDKPTGSEIDNKVTEPGPIFLQGDHGSVEFRKIEIKELK